ncbi:hypothetical protein CVS29_17985 [Arthrobacter psychrochitiniphilus]|uniref:Uncharacterized protein n=1 Tax=Arthrobacter psychrochitiniphilus TaxID=291045 RepID=A0A2V3DLU4_9MICC|nr:hypothetical protein CVS29_17985 [Arthrobacter psychrochitiniphilus]
MPSSTEGDQSQGSNMLYQHTKLIAAPINRVHAVVCDVSRINEWNPAVTSIENYDSAAIAGKQYRAYVRSKFPVTLVYQDTSLSSVRFTISGLAAQESGAWILRKVSKSHTEVTHTFTHRGALLWLLRHAFSQVPEWRLKRLGEECYTRGLPKI